MDRNRAICTHGLVGQSPEIGAVRRLIDKASHTRLPVLLLGETGTGKDVVARALHDANPRGQFVPIDCGSLVGTLMESELFGHVKGAFSGAVDNKKGLVELADGGTAFFRVVVEKVAHLRHGQHGDGNIELVHLLESFLRSPREAVSSKSTRQA